MSGKGGFLRSYSLGFSAGCVLFLVYLGAMVLLWQLGLVPSPPWLKIPRQAPDPALQQPPPPPENYRGPGAARPPRPRRPARAAVNKTRRPRAAPQERPRAAPKVPAPRPAAVASSAAAAPAKEDKASTLYDRGLDHMAAGEYRVAVEQFNRALARRGRFAPAYRGLGLAYQRLGNKDMARAAFGRYLSLNPGAQDADLVRQWMKEE